MDWATWPPISCAEAASSSAAEATACTLLEVSSAAPETRSDWADDVCALLRSWPALVESCVAAVESVLTTEFTSVSSRDT